mgnify:FL=1
MSFVATGNAVVISAGPTVTVANIATNTNSFRFLNANATTLAYVGVYSNYADALTCNDPASGTSGFGAVLPSNWPEVITGNFGPQAVAGGNVYVSAITTTSSGVQVIVQPVLES